MPTDKQIAHSWLDKAILPQEERVWQGRRQPGAAPLARPERTAQGEVGERAAAEALKEKFGDDFANLNQRGKKPPPLDLFSGKLGVEVKTGIASRESGSWNVTLGTVPAWERKALAAMTPEERTEYNAKKRDMAMRRKEQLLAKLSATAGQAVASATVGVILSPDGARADVFFIPGLHAHLSWKQYATEENYIGTFGVTDKTQEAIEAILGPSR